MDRLGVRIRQERVAKGMTLAEVARRAGDLLHQEVRPAYISDIERGAFLHPSETRVRAIAKVVGIIPAEVETLLDSRYSA